LLDASASDAEEVLSVRFREPAIAFGDVGRYRQSGAIELVGEEEALRLATLAQGK
jgi:hypothetical protein